MYPIEELPDSSRLWIYQSNIPFEEEKEAEIHSKVQNFARQWVSHNQQLRAAGAIMYNRFVVLAVDEDTTSASGCSIDKSVAFLQQLQQDYHVDLFDRMMFSYLDQDKKAQTVDSITFSKLYQEKVINDDTFVFDNLIDTKAKLKKEWIKPLNKSWHKRFV